MTWPYDARYVDFTAGDQISSDFLNEIQDNIILCAEERAIILTNAIEATPGDWSYNGLYWSENPVGSPTQLLFPFTLPSGSVITGFSAKHYNGTGGTASNVAVTLYTVDEQFDSATTVPSENQEGQVIFAQAATSWDVQSATGLSVAMTAEKSGLVRVGIAGGATSGSDAIGSIRITYKQVS